MMTRRITSLQLHVLLLLLIPTVKAVIGKPHTTVQTLTSENINIYLSDPANGLWLLKFYAPWCGHCKKLAPTLSQMATYISGKFAIGQIDCTTETDICRSSQFNIKGYPTLKIYKDGNFYDYTGKRDADSMIEFMERMSMPSVRLVETFDDFIANVLDESESGVAFVAFDSKGKEVDIQKNNKNDKQRVTHDLKINQADVTLVEKIIASTTFLQSYGQSSRVLQSISSFALLHPKRKSELSKFLSTISTTTKLKPSDQMIIRIEKDISPMVYKSKNKDLKNLNDITSSDIVEWVKENYMPLVTTLEGHNFRTVTALGKPLLIGITNNPEEDGTAAAATTTTTTTTTDEITTKFLHELRNFAQFGPEHIINKYKFTQMNGKKFHSFLRQFNISSASKLPQVIVVDVKTRNYYQNETFDSIENFIHGVENGLIQEQQSEYKNQSFWDSVMDWFMDYMPVSVILVTCVIALFCWFVVMIINGDEDDKYNGKGGEKVLLTEQELKILQESRGRGGIDDRKVKKKTLKED